MGAYLYIEGSNFLTPDATKYRICGIYEDLPENCQFKNDLFVTMGERVQKDDWGSQNYFAFFRLKPGVSVEEANRQIAATRAIDRMNVDKDDKTALYVFPIRDFYYTMHSPYYLKTGSRSTTALLVVIGMLIIAIACINLVNFTSTWSTSAPPSPRCGCAASTPRKYWAAPTANCAVPSPSNRYVPSL